jgi:hypothetical protein
MLRIGFMRRQIAILLLLWAPVAAHAGALGAVQVPDALGPPGHVQHLCGMGERIVLNFHFYVAALYARECPRTAAGVLDTLQPRTVRLTMLRDVDRATAVKAYERAMSRNAPVWDDALRARLGPFFAALRDFKAGEVVDIAYVRGRGTIVRIGAVESVVPGDDLARLVDSCWLGVHPVDDELRDQILRGEGLAATSPPPPR